MLKLEDNPPIVNPEVADVADLPGPWWVGHTKARNEKAFAWDLYRRQVPYFLPMVERATFSGGRKRRGMRPLFGGYVFFCGDDTIRYAAMTTDRLCQIIEVKDQAKLIRELSQLHRVIREGNELDAYPDLAVGARCRVRTGPLEGIEGIVVRRDGKLRFVLSVTMLGRGAELQIEPELIESVET